MKLLIQIPCYNEEDSLPITLADLPKTIGGIDEVETLVVDDGSTDRTTELASQLGADHIICFPANRGLAKAFRAGLDACLAAGADIIVNTDADNQYCAADIPKLVEPILAGQADMVVGCRPINNIEHFSWQKKRLQRFGSRMVRRLSGLDVPDATSGFRAFSREAALGLNVISDFTYTIETLIQAGKKNIATTWVPIRVNKALRPSRLFKSTFGYLRRVIPDMLRIYATYEPLTVFASLGSVICAAGLVPMVRFASLYLHSRAGGHLQSLILGAVLLLIGFQIIVIGLVADLIAANRRLVEETLRRVRRQDAASYAKQAGTHDRPRIRKHAG